MPRTYKHKIGTKKYVDYSEKVLGTYLDSVRNGEVTQRAAEAFYSVPKKLTL
jgi:hypothetical protein